jgi:hypothetical protein
VRSVSTESATTNSPAIWRHIAGEFAFYVNASERRIMNCSPRYRRSDPLRVLEIPSYSVCPNWTHRFALTN